MPTLVLCALVKARDIESLKEVLTSIPGLLDESFVTSIYVTEEVTAQQLLNQANTAAHVVGEPMYQEWLPDAEQALEDAFRKLEITTFPEAPKPFEFPVIPDEPYPGFFTDQIPFEDGPSDIANAPTQSTFPALRTDDDFPYEDYLEGNSGSIPPADLSASPDSVESREIDVT